MKLNLFVKKDLENEEYKPADFFKHYTRNASVGLLFLFGLGRETNCQPQGMKEIKLADYECQLDTLMRNYSTRKEIIPGFELSTLAALSHYPELKNARIRFISKTIRTTMACRPSWTFFLHKRENRVYKIYVNNNLSKIKGAMLADVPFNAQVGLIGHELAHVVDYSHCGTFRILSMGFRYLFTQGKKQIERRVDRITIAHNLGWQLYDFGDFIMNRSHVMEKYKIYKRKVYYSPEEILGLIQAQ